MARSRREQQLSTANGWLSLFVAILTIVSTVLGILYGKAKVATVQIEQGENGPLEIRIVNLPDMYGDLLAENERLKAELNKAAPANAPPVTMPIT
jgi:hypothetical protein